MMPKTGDISYIAGPLILWTLAEFATILICGCMPLLPKFFQTLGESLSARSSMQNILKSSKSSRPSPKRSGLSDPSGKYGDLHGSPYRLHGKYVSSGERDLESAKEGSTGSDNASDMNRPLPPTLNGAASQAGWERRDHSTSQILRTVHIETMRQAENITPSELERQRGMAW